eukprot:gene14542-10393_t
MDDWRSVCDAGTKAGRHCGGGAVATRHGGGAGTAESCDIARRIELSFRRWGLRCGRSQSSAVRGRLLGGHLWRWSHWVCIEVEAAVGGSDGRDGSAVGAGVIDGRGAVDAQTAERSAGSEDDAGRCCAEATVQYSSSRLSGVDGVGGRLSVVLSSPLSSSSGHGGRRSAEVLPPPPPSHSCSSALDPRRPRGTVPAGDVFAVESERTNLQPDHDRRERVELPRPLLDLIAEVNETRALDVFCADGASRRGVVPDGHRQRLCALWCHRDHGTVPVDDHRVLPKRSETVHRRSFGVTSRGSYRVNTPDRVARSRRRRAAAQQLSGASTVDRHASASDLVCYQLYSASYSPSARGR